VMSHVMHADLDDHCPTGPDHIAPRIVAAYKLLTVNMRVRT
jgi:hypothetical protein